MAEKEILLVDKPKGVTSYDVIRALKKEYPGQKIGHAGTLDPLATGLLLVGVGEGTKKMKDLVGLPKQYEVEILLGTQTDTGDMDGNIIKKEKPPDLQRSEIENVLSEMKGKLILLAPAYSAIKQGGEPLYKKARRGEKVDLPKREMEVYNAELLDVSLGAEEAVLAMRIDVSSGSYVRSIAEEVGRRLGTPAVVKELQRTKIGEYRLEDATQI